MMAIPPDIMLRARSATAVPLRSFSRRRIDPDRASGQSVAGKDRCRCSRSLHRLPHNGAQRATAPESSIEARFDKSAVVALRDIGCSSHVRMPRTPAGFFRPPRAALNDPPEQSFAKFGPGTAK
jgi:hypothetical protein